jgi:hypothetical protein
MRRLLWCAIVGAVLVFPAAAEGAKDPPKKPTPPAKQETKADDAAPVVVDNDALAARYGDAAGPVSAVSGKVSEKAGDASAESAEAMPDALQEIEDGKARARTREITLKQLDVEIGRIEARIAELEKRILATRNPFLPRPVIPEDEALEWSEMTASQRVARTEDQIADARRDLEAARARRERLTTAP